MTLEQVPDAEKLDYAHLGEEDRPPEQPSLSPREWLRQNLFSGVGNTILTIVGIAVALWAFRSLLDFVFSYERNWDAVRTNLRLLFTEAYPVQQYSRVWVTVSVIIVLVGFSVGMWARWGSVPLKRVAGWLAATGGLIAVAAFITQPSAKFDPDGKVIFNANTQTLETQTFLEAMAERWVWWIAAAVLLAVGLGVWSALGPDGRRTRFVPSTTLLGAAVFLLVGSLWVVRYGSYTFADRQVFAAPGELVAASTRIPWTVVAVLLFISYFLGRAIRGFQSSSGRELMALRPAVNTLWLLSPFVLYWLVLRDPAFDYSHAISTDIPIALAFAVLGAAILWYITKPGIGELGRIVAALLFVPMVVSWLGAFFGWFAMLQKVRISLILLLVVALLAPNFAGDLKQRRRFVIGWAGLMVVFHYLVTAVNSETTLAGVQKAEFVGGFGLTLLVATLTLLFSFPLGILLALARTSKLPLFRVMATTFIEVVRGVPLITVLIFFSIMVPLFLPDGMEINLLAAVVVGYSLFSAAYLAENVRGGLQSVRAGQVEAANALGLTTSQRTLFIVLPQALRVSIPPLVGQVIAVFKETSLLAIIGLFDFLRIANAVISNQQSFLGSKREGLLFVSAIYWIIAFSMSKYSQRLERRLGVGER